MKYSIRAVLYMLLLGLFSLMPALAQNMEEGMVKYDPDFEFPDGIYPNFQSVINLTPIPKARLVTDVELFSRDFYEEVTKKSNIIFYDDNGIQQSVKTQLIWGYGRNGVLYINLAGKFHRISFVGTIGHFVATITTYNSGYYDPYYRSPYSSRYYNSSSSTYASTEVRQYLIDFDTGKLHEFTVPSVEILLMKDPELHDEYMSLRRKKKKQYKFVYIRKYNEKHPLYFPERN